MIQAFLDNIKASPIEKMGVILHDSTGAIGVRVIGEGTKDRCTFKFSTLAQAIVDHSAAMITLVHNHPTGEVRPSRDDLTMTYKLQDLLKDSGVTINDHLILGGRGGVYSFADNGAL